MFFINHCINNNGITYKNNHEKFLKAAFHKATSKSLFIFTHLFSFYRLPAGLSYTTPQSKAISIDTYVKTKLISYKLLSTNINHSRFIKSSPLSVSLAALKTNTSACFPVTGFIADS